MKNLSWSYWVIIGLTFGAGRLCAGLVFASSMTKKDGAQPAFWNFMKEATFANMPQPLKDAFLKVNPSPKKLKNMHDKDLERMYSFRDVPDSDVAKVRAPTLIVVGDHDIVRVEHSAELARTFPQARLLVVPGGHGDYIGEAVMTQRPTRTPEYTIGLIEEFLDSPPI